MVDEVDSLITTVWKSGNSLVLTINEKYAKYMGLKDKDTVKVMIKKV